MKRLVAILLLCCFSLYHFGYYAFYFSYRAQLEANWLRWLSAGDSNLDERIMSIPLSIPYVEDMEEFHPANTTFEKDGQHYRAIKQRYVGDEIQVVYVPDTARRNLDYTFKLWVHSLVKNEMPDKSGNPQNIKLFAKDYSQPDNNITFNVYPSATLACYAGLVLRYAEDVFPSLDSPPPQRS